MWNYELFAEGIVNTNYNDGNDAARRREKSFTRQAGKYVAFFSFSKFFNCFLFIFICKQLYFSLSRHRLQGIKRVLVWHDTKYNCRAYASQRIFLHWQVHEAYKLSHEIAYKHYNPAALLPLSLSLPHTISATLNCITLLRIALVVIAFSSSSCCCCRCCCGCCCKSVNKTHNCPAAAAAATMLRASALSICRRHGSRITLSGTHGVWLMCLQRA